MLCGWFTVLIFAKYAVDLLSSKKEQRNWFTFNGFGRAKQYLWNELTWEQNESGRMSQKQLIAKVLNVTGMKDAEAVGRFIDSSILSSANHWKRLPLDETIMYWCSDGTFMCLATRNHTGGMCCCKKIGFRRLRSNSIPWKLAYRSLRYSRGTMNTALLQDPGQDDQCFTYGNAASDNEAAWKRGSRFSILILVWESLFTPPANWETTLVLVPHQLNMWLYLEPVKQFLGDEEFYRS